MRKTYYKLILNKLKSGKFLWFPAQVWKYLTIPISQKIGRPLSGPINGSFLVTYKCNSDCVMCDYPQRTEKIKGKGIKELNTEEMIKIIYDFAALGTTGLGFTGGEPLLRKDIFALLKSSINLGMITNINTNGYLIDDGIAEELMNIGLDSINISFDGATDETFEKLRGTRNGLKKAIKGIENLKKFQKKDKTMINAVTVISPENAGEIDEIIKLAKEIGIDHIGFMPIHNFSFKKVDDQIFEFKNNKEGLKNIVNSLLMKWDKDFFENSSRYINLLKLCFEGKNNPLICHVGYSHIMVDCYGNVFPCWPWIERNISIGCLNNGVRLRDLWYSNNIKEARKELAKCHECFWNCHTELNLLFNKTVLFNNI